MHLILLFVVSKHCDGTIQVLKEYLMTRRLIWGDMPIRVRGDMHIEMQGKPSAAMGNCL